jgi:tRNA-dihydrouridine synthase
MGPERATRYLRKFYPWYLVRLDAGRELQDALQRTPDLAEAHRLLDTLRPSLAA